MAKARQETAVREIVTFSERRAKTWLDLERRVADILETLVARGELAGFIRYERRPDGRNESADFTVLRLYRGKASRRRFGIATAPGAKSRRETLFPRTKVLCFPPETKPKTIERRILALFDR